MSKIKKKELLERVLKMENTLEFVYERQAKLWDKYLNIANECKDNNCFIENLKAHELLIESIDRLNRDLINHLKAHKENGFNFVLKPETSYECLKNEKEK